MTPEVCGARSWDTVTYDAKDSVIRAVSSGNGAAVFMVPRSGGMLRGFLVDGRGAVVGNRAGVKVRSNGVFTDLAAARLDERFVVSVVSGAQTSVMAIRDDLQDYRELALADGSVMGDAAVMHVGNTRVSTTGGVAGVQMTSFDASWASMGSEVVARSVPVSMTSTAFDNDAMISWSTATECHVQRVASGIESVQAHPCLNARLAASYAERGGWLVYERDGSIMLSRVMTDAANQIGVERSLVQFGTSPRIAFDGAHYWLSYVDANGQATVGLLDRNGALDSVAVEGTRPQAGSYDLAMIGASPWIYAIDGNGISAAKLCVSTL